MRVAGLSTNLHKNFDFGPKQIKVGNPTWNPPFRACGSKLSEGLAGTYLVHLKLSRCIEQKFDGLL